MNRLLWAYGIILLLFTIFSYLFVDGNFFPLNILYTGIHTSHRELVTYVYLVFIFLFFVFYTLFLKKEYFLSFKKLKMLIIVTVCILLFSYPTVLSSDVFNYMTTSKVLFFYKENPYVTMPIEFSNDEFLHYTRAANKVALYGPFWIVLTGFSYLFYKANLLFSLLALKFLIMVSYLGIGYIIWKFTKQLYPVALFLLNPLVIIETLVSSHNDSVMMFLVLASFYLFYKKRIFFGILVFLLSIGIKYASFVLFPIVLFLMWQQERKKNIHWERIFLISLLLMTGVFFTAPIREEIYPWYWIWVLPFVALLYKNRFIGIIASVFSLSLLLRYVPVLYTGTYFGLTPILKNIFMIIPVFLYGLFLSMTKIRKYLSL